jgi:type IV pilus assembly protein PilW
MQSAYGATVEHVLLEQRGQYALDAIAQQIRQSGWQPALSSNGTTPPALVGRDDCGQPSIEEWPSCGRGGIAHSDALLLRFGVRRAQGLPAGEPSQPDRAMVDCSGYAVMPGGTATASTVANLFYIAEGVDGEPQLLCRYPNRREGDLTGSGWTSGALVPGVETLQFRYGVDTSGDGKPDAYLRATEVQALGPAAWRKVLAVQIALVLRGRATLLPAAIPGQVRPLPLLPSRGAGDTSDDISFVPTRQPAALRKVFSTTVRLRNPVPCEETLC